jgi:drug/metabolite transporter (DMT)-like permease
MVIKVNLHGASPLVGASARFLVAAAAFAGWWGVVRRQSLRLRRDQVGLVTLTAVTMFALPYGLLYAGETEISSGVAAVLSGTLPLFTALIASRALPDERAGWPGLVGACFGIAGLLLVFRGALELRSSLLVALALLATGLGPLFGAMGQIANRAARGLVATPLLLAWAMGISGCALLVSGLTVGSGRFTFDPRTVASTLYLAFAGSVLPFAALIWLLHRVRAFTVSLLNLVLPVVAVFEGWAVYGEHVNGSIVIGAAIVVVAVAAASGLLPTARPPAAARPSVLAVVPDIEGAECGRSPECPEPSRRGDADELTRDRAGAV